MQERRELKAKVLEIAFVLGAFFEGSTAEEKQDISNFYLNDLFRLGAQI